MPLFQTIKGDETFVANKEFTVNGVTLQAGDYLPEDNEVRKDWRMLELLIRQRHLSLIGLPAATVKAATISGVPEKPLPPPEKRKNRK